MVWTFRPPIWIPFQLCFAANNAFVTLFISTRVRANYAGHVFTQIVSDRFLWNAAPQGTRQTTQQIFPSVKTVAQCAAHFEWGSSHLMWKSCVACFSGANDDWTERFVVPGRPVLAMASDASVLVCGTRRAPPPRDSARAGILSRPVVLCACVTAAESWIWQLAGASYRCGLAF